MVESFFLISGAVEYIQIGATLSMSVSLSASVNMSTYRSRISSDALVVVAPIRTPKDREMYKSANMANPNVLTVLGKPSIMP